MHPLILAPILIMAAAAILIGVAFYRGWFHLVSVPAEHKVPFVLMRKKGSTPEDEKNFLALAKNSARHRDQNVAPPEPLPKDEEKG